MKNNLSIVNLLLLMGIVAYLAVSHFAKGKATQKSFGEINVERINVVEKDGKPKMIITNKERHPTGLTIDGKTYDNGRGKSGGILMYNDLGEENGGFLFSGNEKEHGSILTFDQFKQDQVLALKNAERRADGEVHKLYGLALFERPDSITSKDVLDREEEIQKIEDEAVRDSIYQALDEQGFYGANTFFSGRLWDGSTGIFIRDKNGNTKIQLYVNPKGDAVIEYVDAEGNKRSLID